MQVIEFFIVRFRVLVYLELFLSLDQVFSQLCFSANKLFYGLLGVVNSALKPRLEILEPKHVLLGILFADICYAAQLWIRVLGCPGDYVCDGGHLEEL